ncbi:MAG: T9SS type A sorting domain-containing protein [Calditrichaeota bacterium]|nr:T9SS type A sorting domain-containing protein [Calditrichota bacterium]MBT7789445.1 T9SS type A sorting domain-containing protein [Calditrichota bacterium]
MPENLGFITETALAGDYAYLARSGDDPGIVILDISDLENPQVVSRTDVGGGHTWRAMISTSGDYAYIANERHVFSYDVSDPRNPVSLGDWYSNIRIWDSTADEDYLYLAVGMEGIIALDISDPEDLHVAGFYNTTGSAWEVHVMGNLLIVADNSNIGIYENSLLSSPGLSDAGRIPTGFALYPAFPNPFNSSTTIRYDLSQSCFISLNVISPTGQIIATLQDGYLTKGANSFIWNAGNLPSGLYYITLNSSGRSFSQQLILTR